MKPVIVAPAELVDGFRLAGIPVIELNDEDDVWAIVREVREMEDVGLVLVDERYMELFERALGDRELPMVASFPSHRIEHERPYIDELTLRYLGQKLHIGGERE